MATVELLVEMDLFGIMGHFFHFNTEEFKEKFLAKVPKNEIITQDKCTKILYNKKLIDYPFQTNIHQLEKEEFIDCLYDLFNKEEKENYDNFFGHVIWKIWTFNYRKIF